MGRGSMRIAVIQLCRLGDILQTTPMLRGLRRVHPGAEITLVVHDLFRDVPVPGRLFDRLVPFPCTEVVAALAEEPVDWRGAADRVRGFLDEVGAGPFDLTLDLSHSDLSGLLGSLIPAHEVRGGLVAEDRTRVVRGGWMSYFWSSQTARAQGCFNLVDIHNRTAGVRSDARGLEINVPDEAQRVVEAWLAARGLAGTPMIAVQLGASDERKRWPPERFAAAIDRLPPSLGSPVFVGTAAERPLVQRALASLNRPAHEACGETSLGELAALLARCRLLLTNDTGTMHVASAVGSRVVDVSTGPVFVHETGPYGEGHFVIESRIECFPCAAGAQCHHLSCRDEIEPADVAALVAHALEAGPLPQPAGARILSGRFTSSGRLEYRTVWPARASRDEVIRLASARMWEETLPAPVDARAHPTDPPPCGPGDFGSAVEALGRLARAARTVAALARQIPAASAAQRAALGEEIQRRLSDLRLAGELEPRERCAKCSTPQPPCATGPAPPSAS